MIFPDKVSTFPERLNELMKEKGLAQADLVKGTGIERSRISLYCSGRNDPKFEPVYKLALYLCVSPVWLMGFDVPRKTEKESSYFDEKLNMLSDEGRRKVEEFIDLLLDNPKYNKVPAVIPPPKLSKLA